jgi:hypothetical protein
MSVGVVFVSTGGNKMSRALRSFRRMEPSLPVHITFATSSRVWQRYNWEAPYEEFAAQPNVRVKLISSPGWINGCFNEAIRWMRDLGYSHACCLHDDTVFSPLPENRLSLSEWIAAAEADPLLAAAAGISLSAMEALVRTSNPGVWERSPEEWDRTDLESDDTWRILLPGGVSPIYFGSPGSEDGTAVTDWFVKYFVTDRVISIARLGPSGFIVPIPVWERVGGFGESDGIFYDMEYPVATAQLGIPPVLAVPNVPYIHLHNQSTAFGDPAVGIWGHDLASFIAKYGNDPAAILRSLPNGGGY